MPSLWTFLSVAGCNILWVVLQLAISPRLGAPLVSASLGFGPKVFVRRVQGIDFELHLVPLAASVGHKKGTLEKLGTGRFLLLTLGPWTLLGVAAVVGGARIDDFLAGLTVFGRGLDVFKHWKSWGELLAVAPVASWARMLARMVALNLLPLSPLAGSSVLALLIPLRLRARAMNLSAHVFLVIIVVGLVRGLWA